MPDITKDDMRDRLGNIDQIRDLLFGQKIDDYERRFDQTTQRLNNLETQLIDFQEETKNQLSQLQSSLTKDLKATVDALEKKLRYLTLTTQEDLVQLQQDLKKTDQALSQQLEGLNKSVNETTSNISEELAASRDKLTKELQTLKNQVFEEIEKNVSSLSQGKVSRVDLAEFLFDLCLKVKGSEVGDQDSVTGDLKTEYFLPEQRQEGNNY
jgi:ATP-dependent exoDNAse (exonuclease V) beta subunit